MAPQTSARKRPIQARSRVTVDAIVEATAQVLREGGYPAATVRQIADRAGVGVGSVYQYFPAKEALLAAVMERHLAEIGAELVGRAAAAGRAPLADQVRALVAGAIAAHRRDPRLHRVLVDETPRIGKLDLHKQTLAALEQMVVHLLVAHAAEVRAGDPALLAMILVGAVDHGVHTGVVDRGDAAGDTLEDELVLLVLRYLAP